jgi:hypothetical protein
MRCPLSCTQCLRECALAGNEIASIDWRDGSISKSPPFLSLAWPADIYMQCMPKPMSCSCHKVPCHNTTSSLRAVTSRKALLTADSATSHILRIASYGCLVPRPLDGKNLHRLLPVKISSWWLRKKSLHDGFRKRHDVTYNAIERTEKEIQMM